MIQVPNSPFGLSWYQGDVETNGSGEAFQLFRGRFSVETFIIAPGVAPAPQVFNNPPFPDASQNPETFGPDGKTPGPVQTYHLGLWFNSPADAQKAGCANTVTPFNGEHNAGIQVLNTSNFPDNHGPPMMNISSISRDSAEVAFSAQPVNTASCGPGAR